MTTMESLIGLVWSIEFREHVLCSEITELLLITLFLLFGKLFLLSPSLAARVPENLRCLKAQWAETFFPEDPVLFLSLYFLSAAFISDCLTNCKKIIYLMAGIVTRRPLVLQLHKTKDGSQEYAEFLHLPKKRFMDFCMSNLISLLVFN